MVWVTSEVWSWEFVYSNLSGGKGVVGERKVGKLEETWWTSLI